MKPISVLIADDHALMRQGLKQLLELEQDIKVVQLAENGDDAILKAVDSRPDVILMDINMPVLNGIQALKKIKEMNLNTKVIILTIHDDREYLLETINIGADGYVLKDADSNSLVKAIRNVNNGISYIHPTLANELLKEYKKKDSHSNSHSTVLTKREFDVISLIAKGYNNKEIAEELYISEKTVKNHVSNIFKKINVNDRTQAAIYALKNNITKM